jgi:protein-S-isoprenylcysteine O-methyltransferase Ste14
VTGSYTRRQHAAAWSLVLVQLLLLAGLLLTPGSRVWHTPGWLAAISLLMIAVSAVVGMAGALALGRGLTASPLPTSSAALRTTGVYACVRHPIYSALLLGGAGVVLLSGRLTRVLIWLALLALLLAKTRLEERALAQRFPGYAAYAAATPRLLPRPRQCWRRSRTITSA